MSRSSHHHRPTQAYQQQQQQQLQQQQMMAEHDAAALATEIFDHFCAAITMRQILGLYRNMCDTIGLRPGPLNDFYPKLKSKIRSWKAQALWKKFDARAVHRAYAKGTACTGTRVLVIGAGPCGLRTAIEAQLLGAKVVVVEKRDRISRNNVLHLWPFVITDLRNLGAKKFYGKFCAGSIDHISIRQLQCILLKVALLLGVEVHEGISFEGTVEPKDGCGWRAQVSPDDHAVSHYEFDVLIGADGKRNTLEGFRRKEFRGKLAIAITANFINKKTEAEAKVEEISGVAFIFNQSFFKELYQTTGIDLENIVYYKDETHYFVMTAKKHSLIDKGVIMQDFADPAELLAPANVNTEKLLDYAKEAADFSTKYQMSNMEFAVNHYGKPDVAMFDFTSMFASETSCRVTLRKNYRLLQCLVGDSLLEPFWPTGSGCARGFLSSMDAAYAIKLWSNARNSILGVIAQRESIYRLLAQTTPENLQRDIGAYTVDPATRYPNLNRSTVNVWQVKHLLDSDDPTIYEQTFMDTNLVQTLAPETPVRRKRRTGDTLPLSAVLLRWIKAQLQSHEFAQDLNELSECFTGGKVLCTLINRYRPDLVDLNTIKDYSVKERNELAFKILETELGIAHVMTAKDSLNLENIDSKIWLNYLEQICEVFRGEIPHVKHPKLDFFELKERTASNNKQPDFSHLFKVNAKKARSPMQDIDMTQAVHRRSILDEEKIRKQRKYGPDFTPVQTDTSRRAKKRRSQEKTGGNIEERQKRLAEIEQNRLERQSKRRLHRFQQTQNFYKSLHMLQANTLLRESDSSSAFEDYSLYLYRQEAPEFNDRVKELERKLMYPDRERGIASALPRGNNGDEQFSDRIKSMEQKITSRNAMGADKKPKDLLRAIGKIESSDWNVREIEKKIEQSKRTEIGKSKEKVPKWSKEQFLARQNKMSKADRQESVDTKFKDIDKTLKNFDKQLKEGSVLEVGERGRNKVASIAGQFVKKDDNSDEKSVPIQKAVSSSKVGLVFNKKGASEKCHFCKQTVYLMEKISTEGLVLHRSCLKCHHCHTNLRLGAYAFDRDDPIGRFYCTQHFRLPAKAMRPTVRKSIKNQNKSQNEAAKAKKPEDDAFKTPEKLHTRPENLAQLDLLDRGQTPERIEFENVDALSDGEPSQEHIIDENEWTDRNFITESEDAESNISDSDSSNSDTESEYEDVNGSPLGAQTLQLATDWIGKQRHSYMDDNSDEDFYDSSEGLLDEDDADSQTEGEEFKKARELRKQEVTVLPPPQYLLTDTETEVRGVENLPRTTNTNNDKESKDSSNTNALIDDNKVIVPADLNPNVVSNEVSLAKVNKIAISDTHIDDVVPKDKSISGNRDKTATSESLGTFTKCNDKLFDAELASGSTESVNRSVTSIVPLKNEIKRIDNNSVQPMSSEIDALNEKIYNLNSFIKLQKDVENLKRENVVKNDIMKKLSLKEKWLNEKTEGVRPTSSNQAFNSGKTTMEENKAEKDKEKHAPHDAIELGNINLSDNALQTTDDTSLSEEKIDVEELEIEKLVLGAMDEIQSDLNKKKIEEPKGRDLGKVFYNLENSDRKMSNTLKNIEVKNFADTMDSIRSQIITPKVSKQSSCDLSKYFPNQKQEKSEGATANKNQKSLKDVNLSKYFSQAGTSSEMEKKLKPSTIITPSSPQAKKRPVPLKLFGVTANGNSHGPEKSSHPDDSDSINFSLDQLDGAVDIRDSLSVPTGAVTRRTKPKPNAPKSFQVVKNEDFRSDSNEEDFEELLQGACSRPSSTEFKRLFEGEKSPSEDVSDRIEKLLEEEERARQKGELMNPRKKKLTKIKRPGKEQNRSKKNFSKANQEKSNSGENAEAPTDLEQTMAFLKEGWKTEATRFLESKRDSFFAKRKNGFNFDEPSKSTTNETLNWGPVVQASIEKQKTKPAKKKRATKNLSSTLAFAKKRPVKVMSRETREHRPSPSPVRHEAKVHLKVTKKDLMLLDDNEPSDLSELSLDVSDEEIDKILNELAQDLEDLKEIESKLERKQSLPDVVKSGNLSDTILQETDGSKWTGTLDNTMEELDLLEKGELARKASLPECDALKQNIDGGLNQMKEEQPNNEENAEETTNKECDTKYDDTSSKLEELSKENSETNHSSFTDRTEPSKKRKSSTGSLSLNFSYSASSDASCKKSSIPIDESLDNAKETILSSEAPNKSSREKTITSETDSIDVLFNQLTDDMVVGIEFDSSDEIVRLIPHGKLTEKELEEDQNARSSLDKKAELALELGSKNDKITPIKYFEICERESSTPNHFPVKPVRRNKSISSSSTPDSPIVPLRVRKMTLPKINPIDMAPSVQDIMQKAEEKEIRNAPVPCERMKKKKADVSFPIKCADEDMQKAYSPQHLTNSEKLVGENEICESRVSNKQATPIEMREAKDRNDVFGSQKDEDAYIEELERKRRAALRKRDEMYAKENSAIELPIIKTLDNSSNEMPALSSSPIKSSYSSIPPSVASSNESVHFASTYDLSGVQRHPQRRKSVTKSNNEVIDASTHFLLERSKMLHDMKEDFMNEKNVGKNPYLTKVINENKHSQEHLDEIHIHDSSADSPKLTYRPSSRSFNRFPTQRSLHSERDRTRHDSSESIGPTRKPNTLANTLGPRNFVEYFKRSPQKHTDIRRDLSRERRDASKERRAKSKDSCVLS